MQNNSKAYAASDLIAFAEATLVAAGLAPPLANAVAAILVEGDLMGHETHGLALLPGYLASATSGSMTLDGKPVTLNERAATALWDGCLLPGPWLITEGLKMAAERVRDTGSYTLSIRQSHHTAALTAYLKPVTDHGLMAMIAVSDPTLRDVAPFGSCEPVLSTNPIAFGIPTANGPVLVDISTSETTNGRVNALAIRGEAFAETWLVDAQGRPSRDPKTRFATPPGAIMPLGGFSNGHKGTGLGLAVEALTHGLTDAGRRHRPTGWQCNVFIQVIDPQAFGGAPEFLAETAYLADAVRASQPAQGFEAVRAPGARALALRDERLVNGVPLSPQIVDGLADWAGKLAIQMPVTRS